MTHLICLISIVLVLVSSSLQFPGSFKSELKVVRDSGRLFHHKANFSTSDLVYAFKAETDIIQSTLTMINKLLTVSNTRARQHPLKYLYQQRSTRNVILRDILQSTTSQSYGETQQLSIFLLVSCRACIRLHANLIRSCPRHRKTRRKQIVHSTQQLLTIRMVMWYEIIQVLIDIPTSILLMEPTIVMGTINYEEKSELLRT